MKAITSVVLIASISALTGCSNFSAARYSSNADNVVALRSLNGKMLNIGAFSATKPGQKEIMCRDIGLIKTPDGEPFSDFVRKALLDELKFAGSFSATASITLIANLDAIDFSTTNGSWNLTLTVKSSNGKSMTASEQYAFPTSFVPLTTCNQTAQALVPAVQNLVGKIIRSPDFASLTN